MLELTDRKKIINDAHRALADTAIAASNANQQAIRSPRYSWPGETIRKNKTKAGIIRNIEDLGGFISSQSLDKITPELFSISWGGSEAPYAASIYHGATLRDGTHLPARKWTQEALRGDFSAPREWRNPRAILNVPNYFAERFKVYAGQ
jgi:hypothetical protein